MKDNMPNGGRGPGLNGRWPMEYYDGAGRRHSPKAASELHKYRKEWKNNIICILIPTIIGVSGYLQ